MKEPIELQHTRDFGDVLNDTFVFIGQNFIPLLKCYLAICGVFLLAQMGLGIIANAQRSSMDPSQFFFSVYSLGVMFFSLVSYAAVLLTTVAYMAVYKEKGNHAPSVVEVWGYFRYYFFRLFIILVMNTILTILGTFVCLAPGIYLGVVFSLTAPVMIIENGSIDYTFKRVFQVVKENWWYVFGVTLITSIIGIIGMFLLSVPTWIINGSAAWLSGKSLEGFPGMLNAIITSVASLFNALPIVAIVLVYFNLTEEKEANSLAGRIKMFGQQPDGPSTPDQSAGQY